MVRMSRTKFFAPVGFLREAKRELGYTTQQEMLLALVREELGFTEENASEVAAASDPWGGTLPIQYPDWFYLPGERKQTTVCAPEGLLEDAARALGYPDEEEMLLDLVRFALLHARRQKSAPRIAVGAGP
ncbi:hypothetical protein AB0C65_02205 [Nocardia sp. NPDC048505]|uniref:hypothetical protein n=1 Tax=Nocardia sp. NPDC048505 TaxID=3155756 RepID=UPI0033CD3F81